MPGLYDPDKYKDLREEELAESGRKCDLCEKKATHLASPFGNPDEAALCDEHFKEWADNNRRRATTKRGVKIEEGRFYG